MPDLRCCHRCQSTSNELRVKTAANSALMVAYQCLHCGHKIGNWIQHATIPMPADSLPKWDEELPENYWKQKSECAAKEHDARAMQLAILRERFDAKWWADYTEYLKTPRWKSLRAAVLERDGGWCRGCGNEPATQVHHLTYKNVTKEFMWELVSICDACHDRVHGPVSEKKNGNT